MKLAFTYTLMALKKKQYYSGQHEVASITDKMTAVIHELTMNYTSCRFAVILYQCSIHMTMLLGPYSFRTGQAEN
jgi:hypothetical protein